MIYVYYTKLIMLLFLCSSIRTKGAHAIIHKRVRMSSTHFYGTHKGQTDSHRRQGNKQKIYMHIDTLDNTSTHTHTHCITTRNTDNFDDTDGRQDAHNTHEDIFHHERHIPSRRANGTRGRCARVM